MAGPVAARPFAAFDIDGTLIRWQLYHAVADELARSGHLDPIQYEYVRTARAAWKQRSANGSFDSYELALINVVDVAIKGIAVADLMVACQAVIAEYKDQVYTYTRDLIHELREQNYLLFVVSASQSQIVQLLAEYYRFDDYGGSEYEVEGGYFTGHKTLLKSQRKPELLKQLVAKHSATYAHSVAVGDSEGDIPMLASVEQPIAFNPTAELYQHAKAQGWQIVVERKNVVYTLAKEDNLYRLAS